MVRIARRVILVKENTAQLIPGLALIMIEATENVPAPMFVACGAVNHVAQNGSEKGKLVNIRLRAVVEEAVGELAAVTVGADWNHAGAFKSEWRKEIVTWLLWSLKKSLNLGLIIINAVTDTFKAILHIVRVNRMFIGLEYSQFGDKF